LLEILIDSTDEYVVIHFCIEHKPTFYYLIIGYS
jgi:hypothetical protein